MSKGRRGHVASYVRYVNERTIKLSFQRRVVLTTMDIHVGKIELSRRFHMLLSGRPNTDRRLVVCLKTDYLRRRRKFRGQKSSERSREKHSFDVSSGVYFAKSKVPRTEVSEETPEIA